MSPDSTDKHQVGIIDMVRAVVNAQRKGPCTFLDLLLLHLDNLQSSFQITGLKKKKKMNCSTFLRSNQFRFSLDLIWPEILTAGLEESASHSELLPALYKRPLISTVSSVN